MAQRRNLAVYRTGRGGPPGCRGSGRADSRGGLAGPRAAPPVRRRARYPAAVPEVPSSRRAPIANDPEQQLARILLVQACEQSDPDARFVPRREREAASRAGREATEAEPGGRIDPRRFFSVRADRLVSELTRRHPTLRTALGALSVRVPVLPVLLGTAIVGFAADVLGSERRINLLAFPLLGLLLWNLAVYGLLGLGPALARREPAAGLASAILRAADWLWLRRLAGAAPEEARWLTRSLGRFAADWRVHMTPLLVARLRRTLHVGALGFALGLVAGMYVRGLAFEYRASWESTFLDTPQVTRLLGIVLGPAARTLDTLHVAPERPASALLTESSLAGLRAPGGEGPAALWIHLWALTAGAGIALPRALLALHEGRRARRLAAALTPPLDDPYYLRLRAPDRGAGVRVDVWLYSHRLPPASHEALLELLHQLFGNRARIDVGEPLAYGTDPPARADASPAPHARVVVFNLAQSPEEEVHGVFLEGLRAAAAELPHPPALLVLLDEGPYRARLGESGGRDRIGQRRRAWDRVGRAADLRFAALRPLTADADKTLAEARAALDRSVAGEAA